MIKGTNLNDLPSIDRPREKLAKYGPEKLRDAELLAILLGQGVQGTNVLELARKILTRYPGETLTSASLNELRSIKGLGAAKASQIVAVFELARRKLKDKQSELLMDPIDVFEALTDIRDSKKGFFRVSCS